MTTPSLIAILTTLPFSPPVYKYILPKGAVVPVMEPSTDIVIGRPPSKKRRANSASPMPRASLTSALTTTSPAYRHLSAPPPSPTTPVVSDLPTISAPSRSGPLDLRCYSPITRRSPSPSLLSLTNSPPSPSLLKSSAASSKSLKSIVDRITKEAAASCNTATTSAALKPVVTKAKFDKSKSAKPSIGQRRLNSDPPFYPVHQPATGPVETADKLVQTEALLTAFHRPLPAVGNTYIFRAPTSLPDHDPTMDEIGVFIGEF